jgi:hypothetical protein
MSVLLTLGPYIELPVVSVEANQYTMAAPPSQMIVALTTGTGELFPNMKNKREAASTAAIKPGTTSHSTAVKHPVAIRSP